MRKPYITIIVLYIAAVANLAAALVLIVFPAIASADQRPFTPKEVLVKFDDVLNSAERQELKQDIGGQRLEGLGSGIIKVRLDKTTTIRQALIQGTSKEDINFIEPNYLSYAASNDPLFSSQWSLNNTNHPGADIGAVKAWQVNNGDSNVTVAVIDNGIDLNHEDLNTRIWTNTGESGSGKESNGIDDDGNGYIDDYQGWDFTNDDNSPDDTEGHGSAMSGIIGAAGNNNKGISGVGQDIRLMPLRVGTDRSYPNSNIVQAINYAAANGADIINMSFGSYSYSGSIDLAIQAHSEILFNAAAGNNSNDNDNNAYYPCVLPRTQILCLASSTNQDALSSFSNYGDTAVDAAAPGSNILSTNSVGGYNYGNGTSQATAVASGAAALLLSTKSDYDSTQLKNRLLDTVDHLSNLDNKTITGGRLDIGNATDFIPANTIFTSTPGNKTNQTQPEFSFIADEEVDFQCKMDADDWNPCSGNYTSAVLADGQHTFQVRSFDKGLNLESSPAVFDFTVDTILPTTSIDNTPAVIADSSSASFSFTADEQTLFNCKLDNGAWQFCSSPTIYHQLTEGEHTFKVKAIDQAGNESAIVDYQWIVDQASPTVSFTSHPAVINNSTTALFSFSSSEPVTFECRLNDDNWTACESSINLNNLAEGENSFAARGIDSAGNQSEPTTYQWVIDLTAPAIELAPAVNSINTDEKIHFTYSSADAVTFQCRLNNSSWQSCSPSGKTYSGLDAGSHTFAARAADEAGNYSNIASHDFSVNALNDFEGENKEESPPDISPPSEETAPPNSLIVNTAIVFRPKHYLFSRRATRVVGFAFRGGQYYRYRLIKRTRRGWRAIRQGYSKQRLLLRVRPGRYRLLVSSVRRGQIDRSPAYYSFLLRRLR